MVETKLNIQKVANLRIMEDEKIDMENINYQSGDEYVLIIIENHKKKEKQEKTKKMLTKTIITHQHVTNNFFEVNLKRKCDVFFAKTYGFG
jgi:hypothetical protein